MQTTSQSNHQSLPDPRHVTCIALTCWKAERGARGNSGVQGDLCATFGWLRITSCSFSPWQIAGRPHTATHQGIHFGKTALSCLWHECTRCKAPWSEGSQQLDQRFVEQRVHWVGICQICKALKPLTYTANKGRVQSAIAITLFKYLLIWSNLNYIKCTMPGEARHFVQPWNFMWKQRLNPVSLAPAEEFVQNSLSVMSQVQQRQHTAFHSSGILPNRNILASLH